MPAYLKQAPVGVAGDITRVDESNVEPAMLVTPFPTAFGIAMKYATGGITALVASDAGSLCAGFLARMAPSISTSDSTFAGGPFTAQVQSLMIKGYMSVVCALGTPVRGGAVYICNNVSGGAIGDLQVTSSANNSVIPGCYWATDGKDANNNAEIRLAQK